MKPIRYVRMDPTGNLTCLVLDPVPEPQRPAVTGALLDRCEQVGYLSAPVCSRNRAALRMMGGEFCGNASMAAAVFLCREEGLAPGREAALSLEVSGTAAPVACRICRRENGDWEGSVKMPPILETAEKVIAGESLFMIRMEGITHLIREGADLDRNRAERLLSRAAEQISAPALGLLQWNEAEHQMIPLVCVSGTGTMVWETGCGSGSTALGAWLAMRQGSGIFETAVNQPGGCIRVRTAAAGGRPEEVWITGKVRFLETGEVS